MIGADGRQRQSEMVGKEDCGAAARDYSSILRVSYDNCAKSGVMHKLPQGMR